MKPGILGCLVKILYREKNLRENHRHRRKSASTKESKEKGRKNLFNQLPHTSPGASPGYHVILPGGSLG